MLALPLPNLHAKTEKYAGDFQVGVALFHVYPDGEREPTKVRSRSLYSHEKNYSVAERVPSRFVSNSIPPAIYPMNAIHGILRPSMVMMSARVIREKQQISALAYAP